MPKRVGTSMLASQRKKSRYRNVTTQNLRSLIPRSMKPETNFVDFTQSVTTVPAAGKFMLLDTAEIVKGISRADRIGNNVFLKNLDITLMTGYSGRLSVLVPKDPSAVPTALDPYLRYDHSDFTILHDEVVNCNEQQSSPTVVFAKTFRRLKIPLNMERVYTNAGANPIRSNNVIVVFNSTQDGLQTQILSARLYFTG